MSESPESDQSVPDRPGPDPDGEDPRAPLDGPGLDPLTTVCPTCSTRFRVTEAQLQAARGRVRCGACGSVFDGVDQLVLDMPREFRSRHDAERALDDLMAELMADSRVMPPPQAAEPAPDAAALAASTPEPAPPDAMLDMAGPGPDPHARTEPEPPSDRDGAVETATPRAGVEIPAGEASAGGSVAEGGAGIAAAKAAPVAFGRPRGRRSWLWLLILPAAVAIAAQVLWFRFDVLARDPAWRPVYAEVCRWVGCELPVLRARNLIRTRNLSVQSAGEGSGALIVRVLMVNEAAFEQPFPALELRFSELSGALVAGHRFQPRDYLAGDARDLQLMPIGAPVQLELTIPDPGPHAVNYELNLR